MSVESPTSLNPRARLLVSRHAGEVVAVTVTAPVRGRPLRVTPVQKDREPAVVDLLMRLAARGGAVEADLDGATWARLVEIGLLVPEGAVARPVRFACSPFDPPGDLVPLRARRAPSPSLDRLRLAPSLRFEEGAPAPLAAELSWARVEHADTPLPSWLSFSAAEREALRGPAPVGLDPARAAALAFAGALVDPSADERRLAARDTTLDAAAVRLRRDRYAVVRGLVHPVQLAALRRYYRELVAEGHVALGDGQVPLRYRAHNEPLARRLHESLAGLVGSLAGEAVKPSYVYFASYLAGAVLEPHRDRAQCELSISLQLDYAPEPDGDTPWPLHVEGQPITLGLGDGLVYRGRELTHSRDALPAGHASASLFFHYVPGGFTGSLD
jgi:hypothetical protein